MEGSSEREFVSVILYPTALKHKLQHSQMLVQMEHFQHNSGMFLIAVCVLGWSLGRDGGSLWGEGRAAAVAGGG